MGGILILDDEPEILETIRTYFGGDYEIFTAGDAYEGLVLFLKKNPTVIIADIRMPGMSGIKFARRVRESNRLTRLIFMTGYRDTDSISEAQSLGATDLLDKPVDMEELKRAIQRAFEELK